MNETWFESGGARLFAMEGGSGRPIVMLHGGMANHQAVLPLLAPLAARFRVVAPDLRGSARSVWADSLTFDQLADDIGSLLDHLSVDRAAIGGVSSGSGVALRFALRHPDRIDGLVLVRPIYAGGETGFSPAQRATFERTDAVASRAPEEGIQVLLPLFANLPDRIREGALRMLETLDPASVAATSRFLASGVQPFGLSTDLASVRAPTLLVRGEDPVHPAEVSDLYAATIPACTTLPPDTDDVPAAIAAFVELLPSGE